MSAVRLITSLRPLREWEKNLKGAEEDFKADIRAGGMVSHSPPMLFPGALFCVAYQDPERRFQSGREPHKRA